MDKKSSIGFQIHEDLIIQKYFEENDEHPDFKKWNNNLYIEEFSFEETIDFCDINNWKFNNKDWKIESKKKWIELIQNWNLKKQRKVSDNKKIVAYAAVCFLYIVLPYEDLLPSKSSESIESNGLKRSEYITEFQAKLINICMLHETSENLTAFCDYDMLTIEGVEEPFIDQFQQFFDTQYNSASWFLTFLIFLKKKGIKIGHKGAYLSPRSELPNVVDLRI
jgi:hypothetical protein